MVFIFFIYFVGMWDLFRLSIILLFLYNVVVSGVNWWCEFRLIFDVGDCFSMDVKRLMIFLVLKISFVFFWLWRVLVCCFSNFFLFVKVFWRVLFDWVDSFSGCVNRVIMDLGSLVVLI